MLENSIDDFRTKLCGCMKMDFKKNGENLGRHCRCSILLLNHRLDYHLTETE